MTEIKDRHFILSATIVSTYPHVFLGCSNPLSTIHLHPEPSWTFQVVLSHPLLCLCRFHFRAYTTTIFLLLSKVWSIDFHFLFTILTLGPFTCSFPQLMIHYYFLNHLIFNIYLEHLLTKMFVA